ncbi:rRNA methyltransferase 1 mitochondrial [Bienertia sinuspersici]
MNDVAEGSGMLVVKWRKSRKGWGKVVKAKGGSKSSWEVSAEKLLQKGSTSSVQEERRSKPVDVVESWQKPRFERNDNVEEDGDDEVIDDPRWNKIKTRVGRVVNARASYERPEMRKWNRQETWGKKTYKEAHESSVPKMIGEGVYGVGPVLAALTAERREFYKLYVQEGVELSKNNKKKKDKKGFEKVLKMADKIGLSIKEISKHDLNMIVDNRPHQGLVLDSSPLDMVNLKELDPVSDERDKGVLWVALDEVMDPQNLGAIIRSSYFFGASGVVLCAKNSAPLSGVVSKASAGSLELMEIRSCKNMMQFFNVVF